MDVKADRDAAQVGAGPSEFPSQLRTHMNMATSLGHEASPPAGHLRPHPGRLSHRTKRPGPRLPARLPRWPSLHLAERLPTRSRLDPASACPQRPGPGWASTAASLADLGPHLVSSPAERRADAWGRSAAGPGWCHPARMLLSGGPPAGSGGTVGSPPTVVPSAAPRRAARGSLGTRPSPASLHRRATRGASKPRHLVQPPQLAPAPWGPGPLPPSGPGARGPAHGTALQARSPGTLTFARQLGSQAAVLLGLPLRRNRLRKRSSRQSRSTRGPRPMGVTPTSEPAHQGRRTRPLRPVRTPMTRAAGREAGAHTGPGNSAAMEGPALALPGSLCVA